MPTDYKIEEWKNLYSEIHKNAGSINTALGFVFAGTPAILGSILKFEIGDNIGGLPFLLPFIIIVPAAIFIYSQLNSTARISSYITVFHERKSRGLNWETRLALLKNKESKAQKRSFEMAISLILGGAGIITIGATIIKSFFDENLGIKTMCLSDKIAISIVCLITPVLLTYLYKIANAMAINFSTYLAQWEQIEKDIK